MGQSIRRVTVEARSHVRLSECNRSIRNEDCKSRLLHSEKSLAPAALQLAPRSRAHYLVSQPPASRISAGISQYTMTPEIAVAIPPFNSRSCMPGASGSPIE